MKSHVNAACTAAFACLAIASVVANARAQDAVVPSRLSLAEAVRLARDRNPAIAIARQQVTVAEAGRVDARLRPNPALSVDTERYASGSASAATPGDGNNQITVRLDQEIETAGRRRLRVETANAGIDMARAALADAQRRLDFTVRQAYFQVILANADLDSSTKTLAEIDQLIVINRARLQQGEISGVELRRLQVERLRFADDRSSADLALRNARSALLAVLGLADLGQPFDVTDTLAPPPDTPPGPPPGPPPAPPTGPTLTAAGLIDPSAGRLDVAALQARALDARQDVLAARTDVLRADTQTRLQRALRSPTITVGGGYTRTAGMSGFVAGVTVPLPFSNRNQGGVMRAAAERAIAESQRTLTETAVRLDVQQAVNAVEVARARATAIQQEYLPNARQALDTVLATYRVGTTDLIDLLDAQRAFRETQRTYHRALFDWHLSVFQLDAALGGSRPAAKE